MYVIFETGAVSVLNSLKNVVKVYLFYSIADVYIVTVYQLCISALF